MLLAWTVAALAADLDPAKKAVVTIGGMDCAGCESEVREALGAVDGVTAVEASFADARACLTLAKGVPESVVVDALKGVGLTVTAVAAADHCPTAAPKPNARDPWAIAEGSGIDLVQVSTGEEVDLDAVAVAGKFTIVDFGAPWCGPCHTAAKQLLPYLQGHPDVAVRAISLAGADASAAFATPIAKKYLANAAGLPWFVVYGPDGKVVYRGQDPAKVVQAIDKKRS